MQKKLSTSSKIEINELEIKVKKRDYTIIINKNIILPLLAFYIYT